MRFHLLCELTSSLLVAIMTCSDTGSYNRLDLIQSLIPTHCACNGYTCSDTGSYNRLDLIQSLVPTHCACNGYTCSDTGSYNRLDLIQSLVPTHCACNGYTCSDTGSYNRLDLIQSLIPTHCACNGYTWTYILKPVIDTLIQYVIIKKIQNSLFCSVLDYDAVFPKVFLLLQDIRAGNRTIFT